MLEYIAYNLRIKSYLSFPEFVPNNSDAVQLPDVIISCGIVQGSIPPGNNMVHVLYASENEVALGLKQVGKALIRNGNEVQVDPYQGADEQALRLFVFGPVFSVILAQRGYLSLHASAVSSNKKTIAFLGHSGQGKSTMAAVMSKRGYDLIGDDILAVSVKDSEQPYVQPGFPLLKLWPEAANSLGVERKQVSTLKARAGKYAWRFTDREFDQSPMLLKSVYIIAPASDIELVELSPREAFFQLVRYTYNNRLIKTKALKREYHFQQCITLANQIKTFVLKRPNDLTKLNQIADSIEKNESVSVC